MPKLEFLVNVLSPVLKIQQSNPVPTFPQGPLTTVKLRSPTVSSFSLQKPNRKPSHTVLS